MSKITDKDENIKETETKIVKAAVKKDVDKDTGSPRVHIRAVDKAIIEAQLQKKKASSKETRKPAQESPKPAAAPAGKPLPKAHSVPSGRSMPFGKPMPKNAVPQKKADVPQNIDEESRPAPEAAQEPSAAEAVPAPEDTKKTAIPDNAGLTESKASEAAEPEPRREDKAPAAEEAKAEGPAGSGEEKKAPEKKPEAPKIDYVPEIGVKIIRRAADEPKPEPRKPVEKKKTDDRSRENRDGRNRSRDGHQRPNQPSGERKPKEFVGRGKPSDGDSAHRRKPAPAAKGEGGREKVVAYTSPAGSGNDKRRKVKDKDRSKLDRFDAAPIDLTKSSHKKHSKYKDKTEPVYDERAIELENLAPGSYVINVPITVAGFCEQVEKTSSEAIMALMKMGIMANINQNLDEETAVLLGIELGVNVVVNRVEAEQAEEGLDLHEDIASELKPRPPVITVMGHVDHGKTSLLDAIRSTNVTAAEAGGITQHIGASEVSINGQSIVFLDTPGHEAFTAMRARGAHVTDIAVLVVAADDSVKPQTIESISHARAANVPIIVAINKIDKPAANIDRVRKDLADNGVLVEEWGGDVISVPVSAKTGEGVTSLLEMILLQAEVLELKANPDRMAQGTVIEARLDKARGPVATLLVMNGTLRMGAPIVIGTASGRVRAMINSRGESIRKAGPATAVEITGLADVPEAGDEFYMVKEERIARDIAARRREKLREEVLAKNSSISLEKLFSQLEEGEIKDLNIIIKADVMGSVGALEQSLEKLHNENVRVRIIHTGVGAVNESDVMLASTSNAVIIGFNVRPSSAVQAQADSEGVEIRTYRIIYEIIDDIEAAMKGMLKPEFKEVILGKAEVRHTFKVPDVGIIAGAYVTEGSVKRNAKIRLVRDGVVIHEGSISSLKRFKDDAREVNQAYECGIGIERYNDIKEGDLIECFEMQEIPRE